MQTKKSKAVGVILAVFFSNFAYLYDYEEDANKFWVTLILNILLFWTIIIPIIIYIKAVVDMAKKDGKNWN